MPGRIHLQVVHWTAGKSWNENRSGIQLSLPVTRANGHDTYPSKYPQRCRFYTRPLQLLPPPPPDTRALACAHWSASVTSFVSIFKYPSPHRTTFKGKAMKKGCALTGGIACNMASLTAPMNPAICFPAPNPSISDCDKLRNFSS